MFDYYINRKTFRYPMSGNDEVKQYTVGGN